MKLNIILIGVVGLIISFILFWGPLYILLLNINGLLGLLPLAGIIISLGIVAGGYISS
jgi:hypothetical protein